MSGKLSNASIFLAAIPTREKNSLAQCFFSDAQAEEISQWQLEYLAQTLEI